MFQRISDEKPSVLSKITPVFGDITSPNLGLSDKHLTKVLQSNLVFHVAASLRLEFSLRPNVLLNLVGTKNVIEVAKLMPNLTLMVHFSTGFCCPDEEVLEEKIISWPDDPQMIINCSNWLNEKAMEALQKHILPPHPNTYTYTKRLAEKLCKNEYEKGFPVCVVRPSIIIPSLKEPLVGWIDSLNGPAGLMIGAAKGVIRSMLVDGNLETEAIPLDIAINGIILIAKFVSVEERFVVRCLLSCFEVNLIIFLEQKKFRCLMSLLARKRREN
jgi:alcohol-forming fatty acyl-CoA reductase